MSESPPPIPPQFTPTAPTPAKPISGHAIASMVLGISSLVCCYPFGLGVITGPLAIVFYFQAKKAYKTGKGGEGMGLAGLICGICGLVLALIYLTVIGVAVGTAILEQKSH